MGLLAISGLVLLQGCIAFPPLIQVEHKDNPANQDLMRGWMRSSMARRHRTETEIAVVSPANLCGPAAWRWHGSVPADRRFPQRG